MAVTVKGPTITSDTAAETYADWIFIKEVRWERGADNATLLVQDAAGEAQIMKSKADQEDFIDVVRPNSWFKGFVVTTMSSGDLTFYVG
ncbi:unnamed protein product [marine sediment metagenome]|uniref:Uncharacterized protein n=1 Tax=marine sediment metagenome TaxID=412755 RepID=X0RWJ2_9ZZZZ